MRLDAIVRGSFRADRFHVMKRKPQSPLSPVWQTVFLALVVVIPPETVLRAQETAEEGKKSVIQVAAATRKPAAAAAVVPDDGTMTLRSVSGQEIEARLLSANGDSVRIERVGDGREFVVPLSSFDDYTGERVRQWIDRAPGAVEYSFGVEANRVLVDSSTFMSAGRDFKTAEWSYRVKFTNLTRNELRGARLEYRVVYDDEVIIDRAVVAPGKGANQQDGQLLDLPDMAFNDEVEFVTAPLALHTYEFVPQRGEREFSRDSVKGLWLRVTKNGEILFEYQSHPGAMASLSWDNEDKTEIRVRNRFREQFGAAGK
jgi:hypothetical protein